MSSPEAFDIVPIGDVVPMLHTSEIDQSDLSLQGLFTAVAEAPFAERKDLYREARDGVYLGLADQALLRATDEEISPEERVALLELAGSAVHSYLPSGELKFYFSGNTTHMLNAAQLAIRLEEIRHKGRSLAGTNKDGHLTDAFPPKYTAVGDSTPWQLQYREIWLAMDTCLSMIAPSSLPKDHPGRSLGEVVAKKEKYTEGELLRAAQIYTEAFMLRINTGEVTRSDGIIDQPTAALALLRGPDNLPRLRSQEALTELNRFEIRLRATAITKVGIPKGMHSQPARLVEHGEFVFNPENCDSDGVPFGLTVEEAQQVREKHFKNLEYMAKNARGKDEVRARYSVLLAKYQPELSQPQE